MQKVTYYECVKSFVKSPILSKDYKMFLTCITAHDMIWFSNFIQQYFNNARGDIIMTNPKLCQYQNGLSLFQYLCIISSEYFKQVVNGF